MRKLMYLIVVIVALGLIIAGCIPTTPIANLPPEIKSTEVTSGEVGMKYTYDVEATDPNGDTLTYSLTIKPDGMVIDKDSGVITWTPVSEGSVDVTVMVSDGVLSAIQSFKISVTVGQRMEITVDLPTFTVGEPYWFTVDMVANDDLGKSVEASFGVPASSGKKIEGTLQTEEGSDLTFALVGDVFRTGKFTMVEDATAKFRGTFTSTGTYSTTIEVRTLPSGDLLYSKDITIIVEAVPPDVFFSYGLPELSGQLTTDGENLILEVAAYPMALSLNNAFMAWLIYTGDGNPEGFDGPWDDTYLLKDNWFNVGPQGNVRWCIGEGNSHPWSNQGDLPNGVMLDYEEDGGTGKWTMTIPYGVINVESGDEIRYMVGARYQDAVTQKMFMNYSHGDFGFNPLYFSENFQTVHLN